MSTHCINDHNCLEADGPWRVSTYSSSGATCVEARAGGTGGAGGAGGTVRVRDTKEREAGLQLRRVIVFGAGAWTAFVEGVVR